MKSSKTIFLTICTTVMLLIAGLSVARSAQENSNATAAPPATIHPFDATKAAFLQQDRERAQEAANNPNIPPSIDNPPTPDPRPTATPNYPEATPAGDGILLPYGLEVSGSKMSLNTTWRTEIDGKVVFVIAGAWWDHPPQDPRLGLVVIQIGGSESPIQSRTPYSLPARSGPARIIGASGKVVHIITDGGKAYDFDVLTQVFTER